jgi:hypothetical protein
MDSITQADREAAADYLAAIVPSLPLLAERVANNPSALARAFAAHRRTAHAQGMIEAARICGSLAETTYDDVEGFVAATGCEAAIMKAASALATKGKANGG